MPERMSRFHSVFRLTTESENTDSRKLGDRVLSCFLGSDGRYVFGTYTYGYDANNANSV